MYIERAQEVLGLQLSPLVLYKWSQPRSTSCTNLIFPLNSFHQSVPIPNQRNRHCWWIEIKKSPKYKFNGNVEGLSKTTFWYHNNDTKKNPWVMLCSHCPINDSSSCLHITVYLAVMLQASWHTAEGNWELKGSYTKSWGITKT